MTEDDRKTIREYFLKKEREGVSEDYKRGFLEALGLICLAENEDD